MKTVEFETPTASCGSCRTKIAEAFEDVAGVQSAVLDLRSKRTAVVYDPAVTDEPAIVETLTSAGYAPASA